VEPVEESPHSPAPSRPSEGGVPLDENPCRKRAAGRKTFYCPEVTASGRSEDCSAAGIGWPAAYVGCLPRLPLEGLSPRRTLAIKRALNRQKDDNPHGDVETFSAPRPSSSDDLVRDLPFAGPGFPAVSRRTRTCPI
jgi:hypothetical protein